MRAGRWVVLAGGMAALIWIGSRMIRAKSSELPLREELSPHSPAALETLEEYLARIEQIRRKRRPAESSL
jgi:hypothetical protein